jgi:hypothetical protein
MVFWNDAILAKSSILGKIEFHNPHFQRFKHINNKENLFNIYMKEIYSEGLKRNLNFDKTEVECISIFLNLPLDKIDVTYGQLKFEFELLIDKFKSTNNDDALNFLMNNYITDEQIESPVFRLTDGPMESWDIRNLRKLKLITLNSISKKIKDGMGRSL